MCGHVYAFKPRTFKKGDPGKVTLRTSWIRFRVQKPIYFWKVNYVQSKGERGVIGGHNKHSYVCVCLCPLCNTIKQERVISLAAQVFRKRNSPLLWYINSCYLSVDSPKENVTSSSFPNCIACLVPFIMYLCHSFCVRPSCNTIKQERLIFLHNFCRDRLLSLLRSFAFSSSLHPLLLSVPNLDPHKAIKTTSSTSPHE